MVNPIYLFTDMPSILEEDTQIYNIGVLNSYSSLFCVWIMGIGSSSESHTSINGIGKRGKL